MKNHIKVKNQIKTKFREFITNLIEKNGALKSRGEKRIWRAGLTGFSTLLVNGIKLIAGLVSIPLTAQYLGTERFGLWLTLSTFLTWVGIADLGLSNILVNAVAAADGQENHQKAKEAVSSAFWLMVGVALIVMTIFLNVHPLVEWERVFNVTSLQAKADAKDASLVIMIFFILRLPLSIPSRIYAAYQEGYLYEIWNGLISLISVIFLYFFIELRVDLPFLLVGFFGPQILGDTIVGIYLFGFRRKELRPKLKNFSVQTSKWLLANGGKLWIAQISSILIFQTDFIIISQLFGAFAVASYGVIWKLYNIILFPLSAFLNGLWPAYSEAFSGGDIPWIIKTFRKSVFISFSWALFAGIILLIASPQIIKIWVGNDAIPGTSLLLAMLFNTVLIAVAQCIAMLINGLGELNVQAIVSPLSAISNLSLSVLLGNFIGISGVAWATGICTLTFSLGIVGVSALNKLKYLGRIHNYN
ncbi:MAG TPA: oligosaccharide flippase family protein [Halomicronema sp.]